MGKVFIRKYSRDAGRWIYDGYANAWSALGYNVERYQFLHEIKEDDCIIMTSDSEIDDNNIEIIKRSQKTFLFAQPNSYPKPWGLHPNWKCNCSTKNIDIINSLDNVALWSFARPNKRYYNLWKDIDYIPLAFDNFKYKYDHDDKNAFDICFVGGWADNGFNEKKKIMIDHFSKFKNTSLKCGFFINKNISQEMENKIISSSKICLNIHDAYQRKLGLDCNERTFKSLGLNGFLLCDNIKVLKEDNIPAILYNSPEHLIDLVNEYLEKDLTDIKKKNKLYIEENHLYTNRVKQILELL